MSTRRPFRTRRRSRVTTLASRGVGGSATCTRADRAFQRQRPTWAEVTGSVSSCLGRPMRVAGEPASKESSQPKYGHERGR